MQLDLKETMNDRCNAYELRITRLQEALANEKLDGMVCFKPQNTFYLSGFNPILYSHPVVVVLPAKGKPVLLVHCLRADHAADEAVTDDVRLFGAWGRHKPIAHNPYEALEIILSDLGIKGGKLGYEADFIPVGTFEKFRAASNASDLKDIALLMRKARMVKDWYEIRMLRQAACLVNAGMKAAVANIRGSEIEASIAAEVAMRKLWSSELGDFEVSSFGGNEVGIVNALWCYTNSGKRVTYGVECPSTRHPQTGEVSLPIVWAASGGYHAENERSVIIGELTQEYTRAYDAMLEAYNKALSSIEPGVTCAQVYKESVSAFKKAGFGNNLPGRIGHGIGLGLHESPSLGPNELVVLEEGMAFTVEPGLVFPEWGSVRHSDTVLVTAQGVEVLTVEPEAGKIIK